MQHIDTPHPPPPPPASTWVAASMLLWLCEAWETVCHTLERGSCEMTRTGSSAMYWPPLAVRLASMSSAGSYCPVAAGRALKGDCAKGRGLLAGEFALLLLLQKATNSLPGGCNLPGLQSARLPPAQGIPEFLLTGKTALMLVLYAVRQPVAGCEAAACVK